MSCPVNYDRAALVSCYALPGRYVAAAVEDAARVAEERPLELGGYSFELETDRDNFNYRVAEAVDPLEGGYDK